MTIGSIPPATSAPATPAASVPEADAAPVVGSGAGQGFFAALVQAELHALGSVTEPAGNAKPTGGTAATTASAARPLLYVVTYVFGQTPVSTGATPAPLVKGPSGSLVLTARQTGLTQITPRFTGTVANPTPAAVGTPGVMRTISELRAAGQA